MPDTPTPTEQDPDTLCERCGYILKDISEAGTCPECGWPIRYSRGAHRSLSAFEVKPTIRNFYRTSLSVLFIPSYFFSEVATRTDTPHARWFARIYLTLASLLLACAAAGQVCLSNPLKSKIRSFISTFTEIFLDEPILFSVLIAPLTLLFYLLLTLVMVSISRLTARALGLHESQLPRIAPQRALHFLTIHLLPGAFLLAVAVCGFITLVTFDYVDWQSHVVWRRFHASCIIGLLILTVYPLAIYWIAIKHVKYANS